MPKKFKIIAVIFCILIISGLITYLITPKWKVYRNEEFGFELSYPSNFIVKKEIKDNINTFTVYELKTHNNYFVLYTEPKSKDYKDPVGPFPTTEKTIYYSEKIDKFTFNGINGFTSYGAVEGGGGYSGTFFFSKGKYIYYINLNPNDEDTFTDKKYTLNKKIQDKIKKSFKLI